MARLAVAVLLVGTVLGLYPALAADPPGHGGSAGSHGAGGLRG